jgi:hypothetical protein
MEQDISQEIKEKEEVQNNTYQIETTSGASQFEAREKLSELYDKSPLSKEDKLFNLSMYMRSSLLVKNLVMADLYEKILDVPGLIVEFGTWWGQNLIMFENLRAILEPFNKQRKIIGFDTFDGYTAPGDVDKKSDVWVEHSYSTGSDYKNYLSELIRTHEQCNVLGHINGNHELVEGDVTVTSKDYFGKRPESIIALAYFDMGLYEPTKAAMEAIKPHLVRGSVLLLDELTWQESPGEAIAFKETFSDMNFNLQVCKKYPSKVIATLG